MKVILEEFIKGKGNKGQIIDVAPGYATYLINSKKAIPANDSNMKKWKREQDEIVLKDNLVRKEALAFKDLLESKSLSFLVKSNNGKIFGSVTDSDILKEIEKLNNTFSISKKNIKVPKISTLGDYFVDVTLYKDIKAHIKINVHD